MGKSAENDGRSLTGILLAGLLIGVLICLYRISKGSLTSDEALLLSTMLTILSILGSWIASRYYSEHDFNKSLRLFALKAAEKVTNLSKELDRLSAVLQEELKDEDYGSPNEALLAKTMRLEGAIHIIGTLKSVNDGSLSDWQGVIGEEIQAKLEDQEAREETLRELMERFESLQESQHSEVHTADQIDEVPSQLRAEIASIRDNLRQLSAQIGGFPVRTARSRPGKLLVERNCPACSELLRFHQKQRPTAVTPVKCTKCDVKLYAHLVNGELVLQQRVPLRESAQCPICEYKAEILLEPVPGGIQDFECDSCKTRLRAIRRENGIRIKVQGTEQKSNEKPSAIVKERVREAMGDQPWPPGRARVVATQLRLPVTAVSDAVKELMKDGIFKVQIEGKLYVPDPGSPNDDKKG